MVDINWADNRVMKSLFILRLLNMIRFKTYLSNYYVLCIDLKLFEKLIVGVLEIRMI